MGAGTSALGFGGGFAKGLAGALLSNRERADQKAREAEAAKFRQFQALNPVAFQAAQDTGDWSAYEGFLTGYFPDLAKQSKKTGFSFEELGPMLSAPGLQPPTAVGAGQTPAAAAATSGTPANVAMPIRYPQGAPDATAEPPVLPSRASVAPATPAAPATQADPQQSFLGFQMLTPEQRTEKSVAARRALAQKMGLPPEEIPYFALGTTKTAVAGSQIGLQSVPGELPDGSPAFGVFDRRSGKYLDADTGQPLEGFQPRTTTASTSLGQYAERAAGELGYPNAAAARRAGPEAMAKVNQRAIELQAAGTSAATTARVSAEQAARLLTPDEAAQLQTTYGITRDEASQLGRTPLTPPQIQSAGASFAFDRDVKRARELFEKVWPKDDNPELRRGRLMILQRTQNPQFIELLGLLNRMPQRLAVMEQGSRPSDIDVAQFKTTLPSTAAGDWSVITVPTSYAAGLQLLTAAENIAQTSRESIGIIPIEERGRRPGAAAAPGATGTQNNAAPTATKDAQGNWVF